MGIDEIDGNDLALDQIIVETNTLALLRGQGDVGEMAGIEPRAVSNTCGPKRQSAGR